MISLKDILIQLNKLNDNKISKEELYIYLLNNIEIKSYISLVHKYAIIRRVNEKLQDRIIDINENDYDLDMLYFDYDLYLLFELLFSYTNIEVDDDDKTLENYDLILSTGLYDYIISYCSIDYEILKEKCDKVVGINNINILNELRTLFGGMPSIEGMQQASDIINNLDKNNLKILNTINALNNPKVIEYINRAQFKKNKNRG